MRSAQAQEHLIFFPIFQKEKKTFLVVSLCGITELEQNQGRQNLIFKSNSLFETTLLNLNYKIRLTLTDCFRVIERLVLGSNIRRFQFVQIVFLNKLRSIIVFFLRETGHEGNMISKRW